MIHYHTLARPFTTEAGHTFASLTLAYHIYGRINAAADNVV